MQTNHYHGMERVYLKCKKKCSLSSVLFFHFTAYICLINQLEEPVDKELTYGTCAFLYLALPHESHIPSL